jgi:hypothetical protein
VGRPVEDGGIAMTASGVHFGTVSEPDLYTGSVHGLEGTDVLVGLRAASGRRMQLNVELNIDESKGTVSGVVRALPGDGDSSCARRPPGCGRRGDCSRASAPIGAHSDWRSTGACTARSTTTRAR